MGKRFAHFFQRYSQLDCVSKKTLMAERELDKIEAKLADIIQRLKHLKRGGGSDGNLH